MKLFFFSQILANNNLPFKINCESIVRTFVIKIDTDFNLNVLLKLFFSLSKKIIFFLTNIKIYCENIVIAFLFFPLFFLLHTCTIFLSFFPFSPFFSPPPYSFSFFSFFLLFFPITSSKLQNVPSSLFFFLFFFPPFLPFLLPLRL